VGDKSAMPRINLKGGFIVKDAAPAEPATIATYNFNKMLDFAWLRSWIQPQHLEADAVERYRTAFASHPANLIVLEDFLVSSAAKNLSVFINSEAECETLYGLYSAMEKDANGIANVTEQEWHNAEEKDRFFRLRKFVRVSRDYKLTANLATYLSFLAAFNDIKFRNFFESITGLECDKGQATYHLFSYKKGDFLRSHTDRAGKYLLAFILYLTPDWSPGFGGNLNVRLPGGESLEFQPQYNSLIIFNVDRNSEHSVSVINDNADTRGRCTFSGWLHRPD
jgi:Rps23 Pro-64 3,4-dihydroxylase Tpa1-like proline 4-hydroxylase